jgi:N-acetylmuramoyl-L-alanine amidase
MKRACLHFIALLAALLLSACAGGPSIDRSYTSIGQDSRVLFIVLHYTHGSFGSALRTLTQGQVSSHYLINDQPVRIYGLVDEGRRAWHAGASSWKGHTFLNASSVGIEIVNPGYTDTPAGRVYAPYPPEQIDAVVALVKDIAKRHQVRPDRIVGHNDIAPMRKQDPGPLFPWKRLALEGLIPWPDAQTVSAKRGEFETALPEVSWFQTRLADYGFAVPQNGALDAMTREVIATFQMKYRPANYDGTPDAETAALLHAATTPGAMQMLKPGPFQSEARAGTSRW